MKFSYSRNVISCLLVCLITTFSNFAQCPDGAALTANDKCIFLTWDPVPSSIPSPIIFEGVNYVFQNLGTGAIGNPAIYRNTTPGDPNCSANDSQVFTGVISVGGTPCGYVNGILPLNLISFEGKASQNGNILIWKTSLEVNTSLFEIEKSNGTNPFEKIGTIATKNNNSLEVNSYRFSDDNFSNKISYYRLRIIDLDGSNSISKILAVLPKTKNEIALSYPNPSQNIVNLLISDEKLLGKKGKIYDYSGKMVHEFEIKNSSFELDISFLQPAIYFVKYPNGDTFKLIRR